MSGVKHNAHQIAAIYARIIPAIREEMVKEVQVQSQLVARAMRTNAPKFQSVLTNSIQQRQEGPTQIRVSPATDYALYRETGTRPGKGIPLFDSPEANPIIKWLRTKAFAGTKAPRKGSKAAAARDEELRDRYQGLAWHVWHFGTKATPFVKPTAEEMAQPVADALRQAAIRAMNTAIHGGAA